VTDTLYFSKEHASEMIEHCLQGRPNEACGVVALDGGRVQRVVPMTNAAQSPVRYVLDSREQIVCVQLERDGFDWAVFHSHTRTEAYPSPTDVREAREPRPYIIVSLADSKPVVRAFRIVKDDYLNDREGRIVEVPVHVEG